jgi:hypothetical protein
MLRDCVILSQHNSGGLACRVASPVQAWPTRQHVLKVRSLLLPGVQDPSNQCLLHVYRTHVLRQYVQLSEKQTTLLQHTVCCNTAV